MEPSLPALRRQTGLKHSAGADTGSFSPMAKDAASPQLPQASAVWKLWLFIYLFIIIVCLFLTYLHAVSLWSRILSPVVVFFDFAF